VQDHDNLQHNLALKEREFNALDAKVSGLQDYQQKYEREFRGREDMVDRYEKLRAFHETKVKEFEEVVKEVNKEKRAILSENKELR